MVDEHFRAWHAGRSHWRGMDQVNNRSIGIELENPGHEFGYIPFTEGQMASLLVLSKELMSRYPIEPRNIIGHSDVAPERKEDPGELFDWEWLARRGVGLWPELPAMVPEPLFQKGDSGVSVLSMQERLEEYGYNINVSGQFDEQSEFVIRAFQRHFGLKGSEIDGIWNTRLDEVLSGLLNMCD
jgi:N-acetylmuramoyl-L-alanine amidase